MSFRFRTDQSAFHCSGFNWSPSHSNSLRLNEIAASISSALRFCIPICPLPSPTRNITSDYISRLPHRSVLGPPSLSPFCSSAFLRILYHFRERGPGYEASDCIATMVQQKKRCYYVRQWRRNHGGWRPCMFSQDPL